MLRLNKIVAFITMFTLGCCLLVGCGSQQAPVAQNTDAFLTINDDLGRKVILAKKPVRIVALSPSFLEPLGAVGANIVGRPSSKTEIPEFAVPIEEVGNVNNINIEKVVALKPDLVIAYQGRHDKFVPILENNNIPVIVVRFKTYQDIKEKVELFAAISDQLSQGRSLIAKLDSDIDKIVEKLPKEKLSVAILFSTAKSVTVQLDTSIAGSTAKLLGFNNIASNTPHLGENQDTAPYSLESLVADDPEVIFIVTMGKLDEIKKRLNADFASSAAWSTLKAVKQQKVYYLPQELFLLNPGLKYPEAVESMAKTIYPEVFSNAK